jgi:hypothetical protein
MRNAFQQTEKSLSEISTKLDGLGRRISSIQESAAAIQADVTKSIWLLTSISDKLDHARRTEVFAELGAVLDALSYADDADPQTARSVVQTNLIPLNKAIRLFKAFVQDAEASLAPTSYERVQTAKLAILADVLLVKAEIILGRPDKARERTVGLLNRVVSLGHELVGPFGSRLFSGELNRVDILQRSTFASELLGETQEVILAEAVASRKNLSGSSLGMSQASKSEHSRKVAPPEPSLGIGKVAITGRCYQAARAKSGRKGRDSISQAKSSAVDRNGSCEPSPEVFVPSISDSDLSQLAELVRFCRGLQIETLMAESDRDTLRDLCKRIEIPFTDNFFIGTEVPWAQVT